MRGEGDYSIISHIDLLGFQVDLQVDLSAPLSLETEFATFHGFQTIRSQEYGASPTPELVETKMKAEPWSSSS